MTTENELLKKSYYQTIIDHDKKEHPIRALGEMYKEEMQKEQPELSSIRFAQGEVYFLNHDYETAIYKWQHPLDEELIPWAQKNIADAHVELGLLDYAEKLYKEVVTESVTLKTEVLLQLFNLYIRQENQEKSVEIIKTAVQLNPDYPDVTTIARNHFEDIQDWNSAVELSVNEAIRTESDFWFDMLEGYANRGLASNCDPNYFNEVLASLYFIDKYRFERMTEVLWNNYKESDNYLAWLEEMNQLLLNQTNESSYHWEKLPTLFKEAYSELMSGRFLIKDISKVIQNHLTNWFELSSGSDKHLASAAILAWNERFPFELNAILVGEAEQQLSNSLIHSNGAQIGKELLESLKTWAAKEGLLEDLTEKLSPKLTGFKMEEASPSTIKRLVQDSITFIHEQNIELENGILQEMNWKNEILTELQDAKAQINDMKEEKARIMSRSFREIKDDIKENVQKSLPKVLRACSDLVKKDGDLSKLHTELNVEMNRKILEHMEENVLPELKASFREWIENCEREFHESKKTCLELSEGINEQFKEDKVTFSGDFEVLGDWQRDMERASRGLLRLDEINILLRNNPSQLLLKGAGKLLGPISKSNEIVLKRYKEYIGNADYSEVVEEVTKSITQQLDLFEDSIEWDVRRFFSNPEEVLRSVIEEVEEDIEKQNSQLNTMRDKPEIYQDPITLFELKLRQYELLNPSHVRS